MTLMVRQMKDLYESSMNGANDPECAYWNRAIDRCIEIATLSRREMEVLNTLLNAELNKLHMQYGHCNERIEMLYSLRDKLVDYKGLTTNGTNADRRSNAPGSTDTTDVQSAQS